MNLKKMLKPLAFVILLLAFIFGMNALPFQKWLEPLFDTIEDAGKWGILMFVGISFLMVLLFIPVSVLVTASGFIFGFWQGFAVVSLTLLLGTATGFLGGRFLWPRIKDISMFQHRIFKAVREAVEKEGVYLIALLRMTPFFHFMTGNLFFGSLKLKFFPYVFFSYLGMIPGTLLVVYAGSVAGNSMGQDSNLSLPQILYLIIGVFVFSGISYRVTRVTRRRLDQIDP